jgi:hypothetical protein
MGVVKKGKKSWRSRVSAKKTIAMLLFQEVVYILRITALIDRNVWSTIWKGKSTHHRERSIFSSVEKRVGDI